MWSDVVQHVDSHRIWLEVALDGIVKMTLILLLGWGIAIWLKRHSSSARHIVWGMTLLGTLLVPLGMWLLPGWGIERTIPSTTSTNSSQPDENAPASLGHRNEEKGRRLHSFHDADRLDSGDSTAVASAQDVDGTRPLSLLTSNESAGETSAQPASEIALSKSQRASHLSSSERPSRMKSVFQDSQANFESGSADARFPSSRPGANSDQTTAMRLATLGWLIAWVWGLGVCVVLLPFGVGCLRVSLLCRRAHRVTEDRWRDLLNELPHALGLRRSVRLLRSESTVGPLTGGVFRAFVLLPADSHNWSEERCRFVLMHELAHIKRSDVLIQWATRIVCAIYWFHPLIWYAARQLRIESERACDDLVLSTGMKPTNYAAQLVEIAANYRSPGWAAVSAMAMARPSQLEDRVRCLLDENRPRFRLSFRAVGLFAVCGLLLAATIATAGKVVVRDATGAKVGEITIPPGGTVTLEAADAPANPTANPATLGDLNNPKPVQPINHWPTWGGTSHRNNVSSAKNLPAQWDTKKGENVRWTAQLGSVVFGGVVVSGDRIFVGTNNGAGLVKRFPNSVDLGCLVCFDRKTGKFLWQHSNKKLPAGRVRDWPLQGVISTPTVSGDRLWYVTNRGEVVCLDVAGFRDGQNDGPFVDEEVVAENEADIVWKLDMIEKLGVQPHNLSTCSPTTDGKRLFIITGNGTDETHINPPPPNVPDVICLDRETGKILWQDTPVGERTLHASWSSPAFGVIKGQPMVLMGCGDGWVYAYDPAGDGRGKAKLLWKFDCNPKDAMWGLGGTKYRNPYVAIPVIWDDKVYLRTGQDPEHGEGDADLWCIDPVKHLDGSDVSATKVYAGIVDGKPVGAPLPPRRKQNLDKAAGEVELPNPKSAVVWHFQEQDMNGNGKIESGERFHRGLSSPAISDDGLMFIADSTGFLFCLDAKTGRCHWIYDLLSQCHGSPMIADGKVYVGDEDGEISIFKVSKKMALLKEIYNHSSNYCTPVACGNTLYMLDKSQLHAIELPPEKVKESTPPLPRSNNDPAKRSTQDIPKKTATLPSNPVDPAAPNPKSPFVDSMNMAEHWSSFRNNSHLTGVAGTTLPSNLDLLWKSPVPYGVSGTAAIVNGRVYIGTMNGEFLCLDRKTGQRIWSYRSIADPDPKAFAPAFKCSPTVTAHAVYLGDEDGVFHAIDTKTGKLKWKFLTEGEIISSPTIAGDRILFGSYDKNLYCLNAVNGQELWRFETDGSVHCSPAIAGKYTFITGCDEKLRVINIETGKEAGHLPLAAYLVASPAVLGDHVYFGTSAGEVLSVNWKTLKVAWRYRAGNNEFSFHSSAAVTEKYVVVGGRDKQVHCLDRKTGQRVWTFTTKGQGRKGGQVDSSPVIVGDHIFIGCGDGFLYELSLDEGRLLWKYQIGRQISASPAIGEGCLVIGSEGSDQFIYCFGEKNR